MKNTKKHSSLNLATCNPNQTKFQANKGMVLFASMYRSRIKQKNHQLSLKRHDLIKVYFGQSKETYNLNA
jgi:hypothetical protein